MGVAQQDQDHQAAVGNHHRDVRNEPPEVLQRYYRDMLMIRRFEERTGEMYTKARIGGYCHLNLGEEATIVGVMEALRPEDYIFTNYREHGYILARGVAPGPIMAELFGKETGVSRGRGGSMHLFSSEHHFLGGYGIVGGQMPLAVGAAFALKYRGQAGIVLCHVGDGTTNIGAWHESLNLARLYRLPIVFLIINNGFGMSTTVEKGSAEPDLFKKGCAYRIHGERVDGRDVLATRDVLHRLRERAETEGEPSILEAVSYRFRGHSVVDPAKYRNEEEVQRERADDPLQRFAHLLQEAHLVEPGWFAQVEEAVDQEIQEAIDFANNSPDPKIDDLFTYMYATPVANAAGRR
jgi:pyruvate dehydrogenase E1 component alpha subunit